jgi:two-component system response regulator ResD
MEGIQMEQKILVVDDDKEIVGAIKKRLEMEDYEIITAYDGLEAMDILMEQEVQLLIIDVMMPKMDGWEVCREIRKNSKVPIIMLTARSDERDELLGFDLGVDEYISKPFSPKILVARVEAILRRTGQNNPEDVISAGGIVIDKAAHLATVDGKPMELSFKEFELLTYFLENQGIALSREKILNSVWNYDYFGDARTIDTHVKKLRSKMGDKGEYIKTVWGMGYKFEVDE